jgi:hypothetical protein
MLPICSGAELPSSVLAVSEPSDVDAVSLPESGSDESGAGADAGVFADAVELGSTT